MGIIRKAISRIIELLEEKDQEPQAPCPSCGRDVSERHDKAAGGKDDLIFFRCGCGHASAWYWNGAGPQLIYGSEPGEIDDDI